MQNIMENFEINLNNHEIIHKDIIMENVLWILTLYVKTSPSIPLSIGNFFFFLMREGFILILHLKRKKVHRHTEARVSQKYGSW